MLVLITTATPSQEDVFDDDADLSFVTTSRFGRLTTHSQESGVDAWAWCIRCERAFQLGDVVRREGPVGCAYLDCDGDPLDFWSWSAYCAFTRTAAAPSRGPRYSLDS